VVIAGGGSSLTVESATPASGTFPVTGIVAATGAITSGGTVVSLLGHVHANVVAAGAAGFMTGADKTKLDAITGTNTGDQTTITGLAGSATVLATGRTFAMTGDVTWALGAFDGSANMTAAGTIAAGAVTLAKMANVATGTIFYRKTAAAGVPEVQTLATLKTDLGLTGTNSGDQTTITGLAGSATILATGRTFAMTGDVTWALGAFDGSANMTAAGTIAAKAVTLAKMADVATGTVFYRKTAATGVPEVQTLATLKADMALNLVDNVADANKPVSTAQAAADALKADKIPNIQTPATNAASIVPTFLNDQVNLTGHTVAIAFAAPTGTAQDGWGFVARVKDNGTARAWTWNAIYRAATGLTLPATTVVGKTHYVSMVYNSADTKWDVLAITSV
jgi:hypothetical protein